jgi:hypothetical protein
VLLSSHTLQKNVRFKSEGDIRARSSDVRSYPNIRLSKDLLDDAQKRRFDIMVHGMIAANAPACSR